MYVVSCLVSAPCPYPHPCVVQPNTSRSIDPYIIPDSREGWVSALRLQLDGYFDHKPIPTFDYSQIRLAGQLKYFVFMPTMLSHRVICSCFMFHVSCFMFYTGTPIRGFGGVASGPAALQDLLDSVKQTLDRELNHPISVTTIVDLMNHIGKCVIAGRDVLGMVCCAVLCRHVCHVSVMFSDVSVSVMLMCCAAPINVFVIHVFLGNVRRTAEIAFGPSNLEEYLDLKNYQRNPERAAFGNYVVMSCHV